MPSVKSSRWVFTLNFSNEFPTLKFSDRVSYAIWQHERNTHDHLQGFIKFSSRNTTMKIAKQEIGHESVHVEVARGSDDDCINYCTKESTRVAGPWEYGSYYKRGSNKRKLIQQCRESPERMHIEQPEIYARWLADENMKRFRQEYSYPELNRTWQITLTNMLHVEPDDRTIIWVYGPRGNEGKSTYAKMLCKEGWFYTRGGKTENVLFMYIDEGSDRHVVFDIPRDKEEYVAYSLIESLKDRVIESTKYKCCKHIMLNKIHVVVMANFLPKEGMLSEDRVVFINCDQ